MRFSVRAALLCSVLLALPLAVPLAAQERSDEWLKKPVDDKTFETFRTFFTYDKQLPLQTRVLDTSVTDGVYVEHLTFQSTAGTKVFARLYESAATRGQRTR